MVEGFKYLTCLISCLNFRPEHVICNCTPVVLSNSDSEPFLNQGALKDLAVEGHNGIGHDLLGATS